MLDPVQPRARRGCLFAREESPCARLFASCLSPRSYAVPRARPEAHIHTVSLPLSFSLHHVSVARRRFMITTRARWNIVIHGRTDANEILTPPPARDHPHLRRRRVNPISPTVLSHYTSLPLHNNNTYSPPPLPSGWFPGTGFVHEIALESRASGTAADARTWDAYTFFAASQLAFHPAAATIMTARARL